MICVPASSLTEVAEAIHLEAFELILEDRGVGPLQRILLRAIHEMLLFSNNRVDS